MTAPAQDLPDRLGASLAGIAAISGAPAAVLAAVVGRESAVVCHGDPAPDTRTRFELGSVTKTFTALLLAEMVIRGEVGYDDPISAYLPLAARPCRATDTPITLLQLATHTSGLPRLPANLYLRALPAWWTNPYARYRLDDLYRATARVRPRQHPGIQVHYSNFGVGLLGQLLANAAQTEYRDLVVDRVCRPLGMAETLTEHGPLCATGYRRGRPVPAWEMGALAPAGTLRSCGSDLLRYLQAHLHPALTPLADAVRATQLPRVAAKGKDRICLVWNHRGSRYGNLLFHSGGTRGFTTFLGFCPQAGIGIVALVNAAPALRGNMIPTAYSVFKALLREHDVAAA
ncbi:MAG TPA: serine hydrolase domain-containing protein [Pseudonocardiaceae bacterium]